MSIVRLARFLYSLRRLPDDYVPQRDEKAEAIELGQLQAEKDRERLNAVVQNPDAGSPLGIVVREDYSKRPEPGAKPALPKMSPPDSGSKKR